MNVRIASERSLRKRSKAVISDNLESEVAPFHLLFKVRGAAFVFIPDLKEKIFQLLEKHQE